MHDEKKTSSSVWSSELNGLGWAGPVAADDPTIQDQRVKLDACNKGISDLDVVDPSEVERATNLFHRDGFVVVSDALDESELEFLRAGCERDIREIVERFGSTGNRGTHRFSFGGSRRSGSCADRSEWAQLVELSTIQPILKEIFGSDEYRACSMGGDFNLPGAVEYQRLHADTGGTVVFHGEERDCRDAPVAIVSVNFLPQDFTSLNGPLRIIPRTAQSRAFQPTLTDEPEAWRPSTLLPCVAGSAIIRDLRT